MDNLAYVAQTTCWDRDTLSDAPIRLDPRSLASGVLNVSVAVAEAYYSIIGRSKTDLLLELRPFEPLNGAGGAAVHRLG